MMGLAPAGTGPALVLPEQFRQAADLIRPILSPGNPPVAAVILIDVEAQGVTEG